MNNNSSKRNKSTHLYNPKAEGLGTYDMHYINAYKKNINLRRSIFAKIDIEKNQKITLDNTVSLRPIVGITADRIFNIIQSNILDISLIL